MSFLNRFHCGFLRLGISLLQDILAIYPLCTCLHSLLDTAFCGTVSRSVCFPNKTIGRLNNSTCIWIRWSLFHVFYSFRSGFHSNLHRSNLTFYSLQGLLLRSFQQRSPFFHRNRAFCIWNTGSRHILPSQTMSVCWNKEISDPLVSDLCHITRTWVFLRPSSGYFETSSDSRRFLWKEGSIREE